MNEPTSENRQQAANRHHARQTNTQRIRFVRTSTTINGKPYHLLEPTTRRDQPRILSDARQYVPALEVK